MFLPVLRSILKDMLQHVLIKKNKSLFQYSESRERLSGSALGSERYRLLSLRIINVEDGHSAARHCIISGTDLKIQTDLFIKII